MATKKKSLVKLYRNHLIIITLLIATTALLVFLLLYVNIKNSSRDTELINVLGRQRMLTQVMAKNTGIIYTLQDILYDNPGADDTNDIRKKLQSAKEELKDAADEYDMRYQTIVNGYLNIKGENILFVKALDKLQPLMEEYKNTWPHFKESVGLVLNEGNNTRGFMEATQYINDRNMVLLDCSNGITTAVLDYNRHRRQAANYLTIALFTFSLMLLLFFITDTYRNLFTPMSQIYKGMADIGFPMKSSITPPKNYREEFLPVFSEVTTALSKFNRIIILIENLNKNIPFKDILSYIFNSFSDFIPYTYIGVALIEDDGKTIKASYGVSGKYHRNLPKRILGFRTGIDGTSLKGIIETGHERVINDLETYVNGKPQKEYNKILLEEGIRSSITLPLKNEKKVVGIIFFSSNTKNVYKKEHVNFLKTLANSIMLSLEGNIFIDDMIISSTLALAQLTEERDTDTGDHLKRMQTYSKLIAEFLSRESKYKDTVDMDYINNIERFSPLHDIGKVAIRDDILLKPGKLTKEEFEIMKAHTTYGASVLKNADKNIQKNGRSIFGMGIDIAEGHHEKWNGTGYPNGKSGLDIPLSARIVAVSDVFDALTSKRPYKDAFPFEESVKMINAGSGTHFDPDIIRVFNKNINKIKEAYDLLNKIN